MCEFKTGDEVMCVTSHMPDTPRIYLYTRKDGKHVCQQKINWDSSSTGTSTFSYIKPAPRYEERIIGPVEMMKWLVEHGWEVDEKGNFNSEDGFHFVPKMWQYCGGTEKDGWSWKDEWIEKVEVK